MVEDTKPKIVMKRCSMCGEDKNPDRIVKNRNVCKDCCNKKKKENFYNTVVDAAEQRKCTGCNIEKPATLFLHRQSVRCKDCNNLKRRTQYEEIEELRKKKIDNATKHKKKKKAIRDEIKQTELTQLEEEIGQDNTICKYCKMVKSKTHFRHNRLKCKDCERDDPPEKLKRYVRSRIHSCLKWNKTKHTHEYLGCKPPEYLKWLLSNTSKFTLENYGKVWHIDHVIPLSKFDVKNEQESFIAFNWRNTMPLLAKENLAKNNKILKPQIKTHLEKLISYHIENSIELPQIYIDLFAKHLAAGNPLEP